MRDSHDQMIELIEVKSEDNVFSSLIGHTINNEPLRLRFQIEKSDYSRLKNILQFRPFENIGVAPYRYFFVHSIRKDNENESLVFMDIRVEQLKNHKQFEFPISKRYASNLLWFYSLKDKNQIEQMIEK
jgi:hypothetical protein